MQADFTCDSWHYRLIHQDGPVYLYLKSRPYSRAGVPWRDEHYEIHIVLDNKDEALKQFDLLTRHA
jgi:hypothetical protein